MDPDAVLYEIVDLACGDGTADELMDAARVLAQWIHGGGFRPSREKLAADLRSI